MNEDHTRELCPEIRIGSLRVGCCPCCPLGLIKIELGVIIVLLSVFLISYCKDNYDGHCKKD
jgi:hypothetical protein